MNSRTRNGLEILQVAVILGVLGDVLLRVTPWGLNVTLFNIAFAAGMMTLLWRRVPEYLTRQTVALFAALIFFASMFAWRDAIELRVADTVAIIIILAVLFVPRMKITVQVAGVFQYVVAFLWTSFGAAFAPFLLLSSDIQWNKIPATGRTRHAVSVLRGVAIVAPILLIFGGLFVAADAVYAGFVQRVFNVEPQIVVTHILLTFVFAWLSAGYLRSVLLQSDESAVGESTTVSNEVSATVSSVTDRYDDATETSPHLPNNLSILDHINLSDPPAAPPSDKDEPQKTERTETATKPWNWATFDNSFLPRGFTLGTIEVGVILGSTNLLFLSFVIVQVPYLFGGMDLVQTTPDFKLAEYARRGFGELVTVSALVLPILLASHWLVRKESPITEKLFRVLAGIQIVLLFVIMASAFQRLVLLTGSLGYGLTTIRLYPMILMSWLAIVFVWFGLTVLRGAREHFAWGALWFAFLILGATHVLNPDAFIVETNIRLMNEGREFDSAYNVRLSDDALPVLINSFADMNTFDQQISIHRIARRFCEKRQETDLRSWNYSRWKAAQLLRTNADFVNTIGDCSLTSDNNFYDYRDE